MDYGFISSILARIEQAEELLNDCFQLCLTSKTVFACLNEQIHQVYKKREEAKENLRKSIYNLVKNKSRITSLTNIQRMIEGEVLEGLSDEDSIQKIKDDVECLLIDVADLHFLRQLHSKLKYVLLSDMAYNIQLWHLREGIVQIIAPISQKAPLDALLHTIQVDLALPVSVPTRIDSVRNEILQLLQQMTNVELLNSLSVHLEESLESEVAQETRIQMVKGKIHSSLRSLDNLQHLLEILRDIKNHALEMILLVERPGAIKLQIKNEIMKIDDMSVLRKIEKKLHD
uniref:Uncharacterized protein n=1 Tax=Ditylenchus dipsaci TaxID=166011 RepID=A0A915DUD5_9BILA